MKIAIVGSRTLDSESVKSSILAELLKHDVSELVSGGAREGADRLAEEISKEKNLPIKIFKPDWKIGRHAGILRNRTIVENSDLVIAVWDGVSKGTKSGIDFAKKLGVPCVILRS